MRLLVLRNRQRVRRVHTRLLRRMVRDLLADSFGAEHYELCIHLVGAREMVQVNEHFLDHTGSTDVITFNHQESGTAPGALHGELFVCLDDAVAQAAEFRTSWQSEVLRYIIHGILHLRGHDDVRPKARKVMKQEENRLLNVMAQRFSLGRWGMPAKRVKLTAKKRR